MPEAPTAGAHDPATIVDRADNDTAVILYTSGTTGKPKWGRTHSTPIPPHRNVTYSPTGRLKLTPDDVLMGCLPLFHTFGQTVGMNCAIFSGACLTLISRFDGARRCT